MVKHFVRQPLPSSFMLLSIVGFVFGAFIIWPISTTWGFTLCLIFTIWFVASVYNFTHAPGDNHLDMHGSESYLKK